MRNFFNLRKIICTVTALTVIGILTFSGCTTTVDDELGYELVPENQKLTMRRISFKGGVMTRYNVKDGTYEKVAAVNSFVRTSLYRTDSVLSSNLGYGYMGVEQNDTFGIRKAGFATALCYMTTVDEEEGFGYKPIFDTMKLLLSVSGYGRDTLTPRKYKVYELKKDLLEVMEDDSTSYVDCDLSPIYDASKPLFTFTFPDGKSTGPATKSIALTPVDMSANGATWDYVRRLLLIPADRTSWNGIATDATNKVYQSDEKFYENFKGIYITPDESDAANAEKNGALFKTDLTATGLLLRGRSRNPDDERFIKDTISMYYYAYYSGIEYGNLSVNKIERDYTGSLTQGEFRSKDDAGNKILPETRTSVDVAYIDGVAGTIMELTFSDEFVEYLANLKDERDADNTAYSSIGVNQCLMSLYMDKAVYDWEKNDPATVTPLLNSSISRLGMYTSFDHLTNVIDYAYYYESSYNTTINYGGYINRSRACYVMNITGYMQQLYNYVATLEKGTDGKYVFNENDTKYVPRTVYLGPEATDQYTFLHSVVQGMDGGANAAPVQLDITYTLIK